MKKQAKKEKIKKKAPLALQREPLRWLNLTPSQLTNVQGGELETSTVQCVQKPLPPSG
jgi:hypothetical protein